MSPSKRIGSIPKDELFEWANLIQMDIDLNTFLDPFDKDAELAEKE
jgi:hypothetical protein